MGSPPFPPQSKSRLKGKISHLLKKAKTTVKNRFFDSALHVPKSWENGDFGTANPSLMQFLVKKRHFFAEHFFPIFPKM